MSNALLFVLVIVLAVGVFFAARMRAVGLSGGTIARLHSLPGHYGFFAGLWCALPALFLLLVWLALEETIIDQMVLTSLPAAYTDVTADRLNLLLNNIHNIAAGNAASSADQALSAAAAYYNHLLAVSHRMETALVFVVALSGAVLAFRRLSPSFRARHETEKIVHYFMILCSVIAVFTTVGILFSLLFEALNFFTKISPIDFFFGLHWSPQIAIRADQIGAQGAFGAIPLFAGTLMITFIAMCVAVPIGLFSAIYMGQYASPKFRAVAKPTLEVLAGVPTVVYGFFAALTVAPFMRDVGEALWLDVASESALAAGMVMGLMIIPFVSSLSDDVMTAVPKALCDGSYGLGATKSETIRHVIFPAALPGIVGAVLLAVSRAIGETMIVVMAAGLAANLTANPLESVTTVTVQIVKMLVGDQEFDSAKTLSAFALGLLLFIVTLGLNFIALRVVARYREKYD